MVFMPSLIAGVSHAHGAPLCLLTVTPSFLCRHRRTKPKLLGFDRQFPPRSGPARARARGGSPTQHGQRGGWRAGPRSPPTRGGLGLSQTLSDCQSKLLAVVAVSASLRLTLTLTLLNCAPCHWHGVTSLGTPILIPTLQFVIVT